jgi:S-adenosylmethionine:tRNA ribosyltransferase-isomerase
MDLSDFDYTIPDNQIAQHPLKNRDSSKLFVIHRDSGTFEHSIFRNITDYLQPGDLLILNDTKVFPARLAGNKPTGGKAEITLLREMETNVWEALVKGVHEGEILLKSGIRAVVSRINGTLTNVHFHPGPGADIKSFLNKIGVMPLPIYIKRHSDKSDSRQYQTVYADKEGAIAAPTAGLHFTDTLLDKIREKGIDIRTITLHVGFGTFKPVTADNILDHHMENEIYEISGSTAEAVNSAKKEGRRIVGVGTTVTRALESSAGRQIENIVKPGPGTASMFIYPGYRFQIIDSLITNFHLPKSTPMMLASAFADLKTLKKAYTEAQSKDYRFYSYGDAMMII